MTTNHICPECGNEALSEQVIPLSAPITHDGVTYTVTADVPALVCSACGIEPIVDSRADRLWRAALRTELGLMQPEEIRERRKRLGLTQQAVSDATGIAMATLSRWEQFHAIQSRTSDTLLRFFFDAKEKLYLATQVVDEVVSAAPTVTYEQNEHVSQQQHRSRVQDSAANNSGYSLAA